MDLLHALDRLYEILGFSGAFLVSGLALAFGRKPERACALIFLVDSLSLFLLIALFDYDDRLWMTHLKSILVLAAMGWMTLKWPDRWLIAVTGLQVFCVFLHLGKHIDPTILQQSNGLLLNGAAWLQIILLGGAFVSGLFERSDPRRRARLPVG